MVFAKWCNAAIILYKKRTIAPNLTGFPHPEFCQHQFQIVSKIQISLLWALNYRESIAIRGEHELCAPVGGK